MNQFLTCICMNVKHGVTKNGNDYRRFGLLVQDGPRKGEWVNHFRVITEKTIPFYKKDCKAMGVTNDTPEEFACDGRLVTVMWGEKSYNGKTMDDVLGIFPYDSTKAAKAAKVSPPKLDELPF